MLIALIVLLFFDLIAFLLNKTKCILNPVEYDISLHARLIHYPHAKQPTFPVFTEAGGLVKVQYVNLQQDKHAVLTVSLLILP